jgi:predicted TIM-barrel fold metal-dependent hydrolase
MNNPDATLEEIDSAIKDLKAVGIQFFTNVKGKPLDLPEFKPLFEKMAAYDLPIWIHPARGANFPDYLTEKKSKYEIWWTFGWPYETSVMMARLVFAGYFDAFPSLKIITHHMGGMIPFFEGRVGPGWDQLGSRTSDEDYSHILKSLKKPHLEYFKMFYADTALFGSLAGTLCGLAFFGVDQILFGSDSPFDPEKGPGYIRETIKTINVLPISEAERQKIFEGNAKKLLKLT